MIILLLDDLITRFKSEKNRAPQHANELLDYTQKTYIFGELSIVEYKKLFFQLDKLEAEKPQSFFINTNSTSFEKVDLPG